MLSSLLLALREGLEAALAVGIVLVYLDRTGRRGMRGFVWGGVTLAVGSSLGVAWLLQRWKVNEDGFEGLLMLAAAVLVVTMIFWMNRVARTLKKHIEERVAGLAERGGAAAGLGIALFVFLMVVREGAELVLILRAVQLSSEGLGVWLGTAAGLGLAVLVGVFFFEGTLRIPIGKFFAVTTTILMVVAFQLALTGMHELSEAEWIPSSRREMALIGPIVRNEVFFFVLILGVACVAVAREWFAPETASRAENPAGGDRPANNPAEQRRQEWERRKQRRWSVAAASGFLLVLVLVAGEYVYARAGSAVVPAQVLTAENNQVEIPLMALTDSSLHFYSAEVRGNVIRFLVIHKMNGDYTTVLDACQICGGAGYRQQGANIICRNCAAVIYGPSVGEVGGCNPIPVKSHVEGQQVVVDLTALADAVSQVHK